MGKCFGKQTRVVIEKKKRRRFELNREPGARRHEHDVDMKMELELEMD